VPITMKNMKKLYSQRGDTIIEVLIAITVAALALGLSYSTANKSMQKSISARERNEATNLLQSQIASLKLREQKMDKTTFNSNFSETLTTPSSFKHFCLDESSTSSSDPNWQLSAATTNAAGITGSSPLANPPYTGSLCIRHQPSTDYYIDIVAYATPNSVSSTTPTIYQFNVRWAAVGTGQTNQASVYYRF
jgi:Tfp pilus assembly protein PilV